MIATLIFAALAGQTESQVQAQSISMRTSDVITKTHLWNVAVRRGWRCMYAQSTFAMLAFKEPVPNLREMLRVDAPEELFDIGLSGPGEERRPVGREANLFEDAVVLDRDAKGGFILAPFDVKAVANALKKEKEFALDRDTVVAYIARPYLEKPDKYAVGFEVFVRGKKDMFRVQICNKRVSSVVTDYPS